MGPAPFALPPPPPPPPGGPASFWAATTFFTPSTSVSWMRLFTSFRYPAKLDIRRVS
jgi:hypothetical protein